ncbi:hypothetical protein BDF19DRAFT_447489 [Syncephalis fuscata]|nr:hypothetical protein BDF19DRAFT_447489 [Syncephalis fuscata]
MALLVDCHAHLYPPYYSTSELVAQGDGLPICIIVTERYSDIQAIEAWLSLPEAAALNNRIALCIGLHPMQPTTAIHPCTTATNDANNATATATTVRITDWFTSQDAFEHYALSSPKVVGIGEIGLDFSPHVLATHPNGVDAARIEQREVLLAQLQLARRLELPVNLHSRQAGRHVLDVLREAGYSGEASATSNVLLHAFDGRPKYIKEGLGLGAYFSVAPSLARDSQLERLVQLVPLDRLVLESDAPALGMVRGEPSTPSQIEWVCKRIAELKGVSTLDVATATTRNAYRIFPKLKTITGDVP